MTILLWRGPLFLWLVSVVQCQEAIFHLGHAWHQRPFHQWRQFYPGQINNYIEWNHVDLLKSESSSIYSTKYIKLLLTFDQFLVGNILVYKARSFRTVFLRYLSQTRGLKFQNQRTVYSHSSTPVILRQNHNILKEGGQLEEKGLTCKIGTLQHRPWGDIYNFDSWFFGGN